MICPKCQKEAWDYYEGARGHEDCPYAPCDDQACRALLNPHSVNGVIGGDTAAYVQRLNDAIEHWRRHKYLGGCSHSR